MLAPGVSAKAFGISPPYIVNENLKPGSNFVYVVDLNTNDPSEDLMVEVQILGDSEVTEWLSIRNADSLVMKKGQKHTPMNVNVNIPEDAKLGKYKGNIRVKVVPKDIDQKETISILLGANITVDLNVINYDVTDYWIKSVAVSPVKVGQPVKLKVNLKNLGNTKISEVPVDVELYDYNTNDFVTKGSGSKLTTQVQPHTMKEAEMAVAFPDLPVGKYWAKVNVKKGWESVYQNRLYLAVDELDINNSLKTSVDVATQAEVDAAKAAAVSAAKEDALRAVALNPLDGRNVNVQTSVTVRAPYTNQLIGIVIALLGIIVIVTSKIFIIIKKRRR